MTKKQIFKALGSVGALLTKDHFLYTSGRHGTDYVNKDAVYPHTKITSQLCEVMAKHFQKSAIEAVIGPALGGIILSQWVAFHLTRLKKKEVVGVYAEKLGDSFTFTRGYGELIQGKSVLVVEDVLTTGGSVKKIIELSRAQGAHVVGVAALCNRGDLTASALEVENLCSLVEIDLKSYPPNECPQCAEGIPLNTSVGKGKSKTAG